MPSFLSGRYHSVKVRKKLRVTYRLSLYRHNTDATYNAFTSLGNVTGHDIRTRPVIAGNLMSESRHPLGQLGDYNLDFAFSRAEALMSNPPSA